MVLSSGTVIPGQKLDNPRIRAKGPVHKDMMIYETQKYYSSYMTPTHRGSNKIDFAQVFIESELEKIQRSSKIICTIGPASSSVETLVEMLDAGMNIARFNFSHGNLEEKCWKLKNLKEALSLRPQKKCGLLMDLKGPEVRTTTFPCEIEQIEVKAGQQMTIVADPKYIGTKDSIGCSYEALPSTVNLGDMIYIADGNLSCEVKEIKKDRIIVECLNDFTIGERKNMNIPGARLEDLPTLTEKDIFDIEQFAIQNEVNFIAASFVRSSKDVE